ncbi:MAG: SpoIIE family protein phosphatase [bacterium]|nr:SpoIIE family protein phosphatase [bacterium]
MQAEPKKSLQNSDQQANLHRRIAELEQALAEHKADLNRQIRPKEALLEINRAVQELTRPSHLERVLQVCYDALHSVGLDFQGLAIHRILNEAEATFESYQFRPSRKIEVMIRTVPNIKRMWQSGRTSYRPDLQEDLGGMLPETLKALCERYGMEVRCLLDIPHPRGTLALLSTSPCAFSESEIQFVEQVSEVLSVGITRVEDLEQLARSQKDLAESRQHLELTLEAARVGVWDSNLTTGKLLWSDSVAPLFGLPPGTFPDTREAFYECVHPDDRDLVQTAADQAIKDDSEFRVEHRVVHPDDTILWIESKARLFHQKDGIHLRGTVMDITERKEAEKMQRVEDELKLAEEIQNSFLPSIPPDVAGFELGGYLQASGRIGGDFYDFIAFPNQNIGVALGDATGKGIPGALLIAKAQSVLRAQAQDTDRLSDGITTLNQVLSMDNEAGRFVTLFYAIIDITEKRLTYVNAGHAPGLLFQKNGMRQLESSGPPLGMFVEATYTQNEVSLYPDDLLMICSDGVSEAMDEKEAFFDEGPILETIQEYRAQSATDLARVICEASEKFEAGNQRTPDDKTVVVIKVDP